MRKNQIIIIFAMLLAIGTSCEESSKGTNSDISNTVGVKYDSLFGLFIKSNHHPGQIVPPGNLEYHKAYPLARDLMAVLCF